MECYDITYEFLEENVDINYEIAGYVKVKLARLVKCLKMLKNMF